MAYDSNLWLTGTTSDPEQDITATGSGSAKNVGAERDFEVQYRVAGTVTGTSPTLDMRVQDSPDGSTDWQTILTFAQKTATDVGYQATGPVVRPEVPASSPKPTTMGLRTRAGRAHLRADWTVGGSASPTFNDTSVTLIPKFAY